MRIDIVTLFPETFEGWSNHSIIGRAQSKGAVDLHVHNLRDHAENKHNRVDEAPFGGGGGMLIQAPPVLRQIRAFNLPAGTPVIAASASGEPWTDSLAREHAGCPRLVILCGHYEGFDQRALDLTGAREVSVGDFVMTGGELPAMCISDSIIRLLPGVLGNELSAATESHASGTSGGLLEGPHYTRPEVVEGIPVPELLMSGDHARIARFRREESLKRTWERRPELIRRAELEGRLTAADMGYLKALGYGGG